MTKDHVPVVAYLRRSTNRQERSIPDQQKAIQEYALAHGMIVVRSYVDDALSGTTSNDRQSFQEMIADAQETSREWKAVLVYDIKRFGRVDNDEAGHYRYILKNVGIEVIYITENFTGNSSDDIVRTVKQWQAREESKDLSKVTLRGQLSLSEEGWWLGGSPPFGYDLLYHDSTGKPFMTVRFHEACHWQSRRPAA